MRRPLRCIYVIIIVVTVGVIFEHTDVPVTARLLAPAGPGRRVGAERDACQIGEPPPPNFPSRATLLGATYRRHRGTTPTYDRQS
jgi:hypothetical protein